MTTRTKTSLTLHFTLALVSGLLTSGLAQADDDELSVDGSYNAIFTQFDFVGQGNTLVVFQVTLQGPFELSIGGVTRTGTITFPHLLNIPTDNSPTEKFSECVASIG